MKHRDLTILSTHAVYEVLGALAPALERACGCKLSVSYNPTATIKREIERGAVFDIAILTRPAIDELADRGMVLHESCANIARCGLGVAVRRGARKPDIGSIDGFRRSLLAAESVVRSKDGASGQYFETLLDRLGIAEAMRGKIKLGPAGRIAEAVARGEAELAVQQVSELLPIGGAEFVGPFPAELQVYTDFAAGIATASKNRPAAEAFVGALTAPAAAPLFEAKGLEPPMR